MFLSAFGVLGIGRGSKVAHERKPKMVTLAHDVLPIIPSRNTVIFPGSSVPLRVGRSKSKAGVERAGDVGLHVIVVAQKKDAGEKDPSASQIHRVGTLCKIEKVVGSPEQGYQILVRGLERVRLTEVTETARLLEARFEPLDDIKDVDDKTSKALLESFRTLAHEILSLVPGDTRQLGALVDAIDETALLANMCAENLQLPIAKKQELLEQVSQKARWLDLLQLMQSERESLRLQSEIREKLGSRLGKQQREGILREQLKAIKEELGEGPEGKDGDDYFKRIADTSMPEDVKKVAIAEAKRLEGAGQMSPESNVIRNYLDLLCTLPWANFTQDDIDLDSARALLDSEHFGLEKIKKRIVQHLAVMKLKKSMRGSILLFVGPPGVGKTSLGQSVAKAMGRKFVRANMGGVRDDAEIRGHRRTYIGAMPGRIIQGIKRAGVNNPVLMLDEIDKLGRGYGGDPAAALLEVLDPEQNVAFSDHYLDVPFDLSKVFFIATANSLESIPGPLLDRCEVIELDGYTSAEKMHIAKNHIIQKQLEEHGLTKEQVVIGDDTLLRLITHYTREAGVRELQRLIGGVSRATTEKVLATDVSLPVRVGISDLEEILGPEKYLHEVAERYVPPGVVTGLAWTPRGGDILFIESSLMPGTGKLILTGQLGDVMKESAQIALSLVRANLPALAPGFDYERKDIHIHVPSGAIPKDGPSAGVTMLTAIASLFSNRRVSPKLAMTGEITLRGAVTPVGGIKEKILAAHRAGIERVILSRKNERDLRDVPEEIKSQLKFEVVDTVADVLRIALGLEAGPVQLGLGEAPVTSVPSVA